MKRVGLQNHKLVEIKVKKLNVKVEKTYQEFDKVQQ